MTKKDLTEVALKIVGIYLLTLTINNLGLVFRSSNYFVHPLTDSTVEDLIYLWVGCFNTLLYGFGFWLLTFKTSYLSEKLIPNDTDVASFTIDKTAFLQILFCAAGIIIVFFSISDFWDQITMTSLWDYSFVPNHKRLLYYLLLYVPSTSKIVIGLVFMLFSKKISHLLT